MIELLWLFDLFITVQTNVGQFPWHVALFHGDHDIWSELHAIWTKEGVCVLALCAVVKGDALQVEPIVTVVALDHGPVFVVVMADAKFISSILCVREHLFLLLEIIAPRIGGIMVSSLGHDLVGGVFIVARSIEVG